MVSPTKPAALGPFLGLSNRRTDYELHKSVRGPGSGDYLTRAENVDVTKEGNLKRRKGYANVIHGGDCHSLWSNQPDTPDVFFADGLLLKRIAEQTGSFTVTTVRSDLPLGRLLSYTHDGVDTIYTDGVGCYRVTGNVSRPLSPPLLAATPAVAAASGGSVPTGSYQVGFAYIDSTGRAGGTTDAQVVNVTAGTIAITNLPAAFPTGVVALNVYLSPTNGDQLFRAQTLSSAQTTLNITVLPTLGGLCQTRYLKPLPAGSIMRFSAGRAFVAVGPMVYYSEPYMPGLYKPHSGYIPFVDNVTMIESVPSAKNAVYIATDSDTYFFGDDIASATMKPVLPYGAVPRASGLVLSEEKVWWLSTRGICTGDDSGTAANRQEAEVMVNPAQAGAGLYREQDGMKQFVAGAFGAQATKASVGSWAEAEIIHKATL